MLTKISKTAHRIIKKLFGDQFEISGFITYSNNIQWFAIAKIASLILSFLTTLIVARLFGPEQFGILSYVTSIVGLFSIFATFGIGTIIYKELVLHKNKREEIFGSAFSLNAITALSTLIVVSVFLFFINESFYVKSIIFLMSLTFVTQPLTLLSFDFLKDKEGKYVAIAQTASLLISSVLKILVTYLYSSVTIFIGILILENIILGGIYTYQIKKIKLRTLSFKIKKAQVYYLFYSSLPMILYSAFSEIYSRIDQVMLKSYINIETVGIYAASVRITEIWYLIPNILLGALFPALANVKENTKEYSKRYNILFALLTGSAFIICFAIFFLKEYIVNIVYGKEFAEAAPILGLYIFSIVGFFMSSLLYQDLFLRNNKWSITLIPFFTAILNVALNIYLIPAYGAMGAALATVISYNLVPVVFYTLKLNKSSILQV
jgi:O-antigen/teichoic acid export membrane protein